MQPTAHQVAPAAGHEIQVQGKFYTGPLPQAEEMERYERITPGLADRIVKMAEKEQGHRHKIERRRNFAQIWITSAGQWFGFLLAAWIIGIAGFLLYHDKKLEGFVSLLTGIGTLIGPFVYRRRRPAQQDARL
jgi:uncharacterized membrane protein